MTNLVHVVSVWGDVSYTLCVTCVVLDLTVTVLSYRREKMEENVFSGEESYSG